MRRTKAGAHRCLIQSLHPLLLNTAFNRNLRYLQSLKQLDDHTGGGWDWAFQVKSRTLDTLLWEARYTPSYPNCRQLQHTLTFTSVLCRGTFGPGERGPSEGSGGTPILFSVVEIC